MKQNEFTINCASFLWVFKNTFKYVYIYSLHAMMRILGLNVNSIFSQIRVVMVRDGHTKSRKGHIFQNSTNARDMP